MFIVEIPLRNSYKTRSSNTGTPKLKLSQPKNEPNQTGYKMSRSKVLTLAVTWLCNKTWLNFVCNVQTKTKKKEHISETMPNASFVPSIFHVLVKFPLLGLLRRSWESCDFRSVFS